MTTRQHIVVRATLISARLFAAAHAKADFITDRPALNAILGDNAVNETFETFNIADGSAVLLNTNTLNSTTVVPWWRSRP